MKKKIKRHFFTLARIKIFQLKYIFFFPLGGVVDSDIRGSFVPQVADGIQSGYQSGQEQAIPQEGHNGRMHIRPDVTVRHDDR